MNLQEIHEQIQLLKKNISKELNLSTLWICCQITNTQFLAPRVKPLFSKWLRETDNFIFSCADDPNLCQFSLHREWTHILFAWVREEGVYLFRFPKEFVLEQKLHTNHADAEMVQKNALFKKSLRLSFEQINSFCDFLVEII
jgi:hypothetical protein